MPEQESVPDRERAVAKELVTIMEVVRLVEGTMHATLLPSEKAAIVGALLARGDFREANQTLTVQLAIAASQVLRGLVSRYGEKMDAVDCQLRNDIESALRFLAEIYGK